MTTVSANDAKQNFDAVLDQVRQGPVCIQRNDRDIAVVLSAEEYEKLTRESWREFDRISALAAAQADASGLTEAKLNDILADS